MLVNNRNKTASSKYNRVVGPFINDITQIETFFDSPSILCHTFMLTLQSWSKTEILGGIVALDKVDKSPKT